jgi:hypothetical protein
MNIKDIEGREMSFDGDKLDQIFGGQKFLMQGYKSIAENHFSKVFGSKVSISDQAWGGTESNLHTKTGNFLIKDMLDAAIQELSESIQSMKNWKSWKQTEVPTDVEHWQEEMIDALHFFVEACILADITPVKIHELYFKKHQVNQFRQESNY